VRRQKETLARIRATVEEEAHVERVTDKSGRVIQRECLND
jgi:hypothetical protein